MPYIKENFRQDIRKELDALGDKILDVYEKNPQQTRDGLLNFAITELLGKIYKDANYHSYNEAIGMLECCKLELYRKRIAPYENQKEHENGSVTSYDTNKSSGY